MISIDDFLKLKLKVGTVLEAEALEESEKLIKLQVDIGEEIPRQILAGIKLWYKPEDLIGKQVIVIANLEPRMMMGFESRGMLLAADSEEGPSFLTPFKPVNPGSKIK